MSQANVWSQFTVPDPIKLSRIENNTYMMTSHDPENACQLMKIDKQSGFNIFEKLPTENHKVFSACLLDSGVKGISMTLAPGSERSET